GAHHSDCAWLSADHGGHPVCTLDRWPLQLALRAGQHGRRPVPGCVRNVAAEPLTRGLDKQKGRPTGRPSLQKICYCLECLDVLCLQALGSLDDVELHRLAFLQAAEALVLNGGVVNEHVLAVLAADETIAFGVIEPLHCSLFHVLLSFYRVNL